MFRALSTSFIKKSQKVNALSQRSFARNQVLRATEEQKPSAIEKKKDFASPPFIRLHETLPTDLGVQLENDPDFDVRVTIPSHFESAVGNDRAELLDPDIWHELLPLVIPRKSKIGAVGEVGSSALNPIIIPSLGFEERVISCSGECYNPDADLDSIEWQYWVMKEDSFGMCDQCGLVFFLASPHVIAQMEIWDQLEKEWTEEDQIACQTMENPYDPSKNFAELMAEYAKEREKMVKLANSDN